MLLIRKKYGFTTLTVKHLANDLCRKQEFTSRGSPDHTHPSGSQRGEAPRRRWVRGFGGTEARSQFLCGIKSERQLFLKRPK